MKFSGSIVALVTPFDRNGRIDRKSLERLVAWHIQEGTDGIVCCGSTGEGVSLSASEKKRVVAICIEAARGRIPIIATSGTSSTKESVQLTEQMQKLGAKGCLVVTPYYNKPTQRGCVLHYREVAKVGLPIIVYHNPGRAVVRLMAETIAEISEIPGVAALKDSSGDLEFIRKVGTLCRIPILSGEDDLTFDTIREGGVGAISVIGNVFPKMWKRMISLSLEGKWTEAKAIAERFLPACKAGFLETNPQCVKFTMEWMKLCPGFLRLPLVRVAEETQKEIKQVLVSLFLPQFKRVRTPVG